MCCCSQWFRSHPHLVHLGVSRSPDELPGQGLQVPQCSARSPEAQVKPSHRDLPGAGAPLEAQDGGEANACAVDKCC